MASSNIKLFDENKGNMLNDTEFNISTQRLNGLQAGVASSQLQNKAMYQASLIAYAIAQLMLANGKNANDTDAVSAFVGNLSASIVQKVLDKATKQDIKAGTVGKWVSSELLKSNNEDLASIYLKLAGGTMLGNLFLNADPTSALQAVTKRYVDSNFAKLQAGTYTGTGTYGESNPCSITFNFVPKILMLFEEENSYLNQRYSPYIYGESWSAMTAKYPYYTEAKELSTKRFVFDLRNVPSSYSYETGLGLIASYYEKAHPSFEKFSSFIKNKLVGTTLYWYSDAGETTKSLMNNSSYTKNFTDLVNGGCQYNRSSMKYFYFAIG